MDLAEVPGEEDEDAIRFAEIDRPQDDRFGAIRARDRHSPDCRFSIATVASDTDRMGAAGIPRDIVLEPAERVILSTKPLAMWLPVTLILVALGIVVLYFWSAGSVGLFSLLAVVAVALSVVALAAWLRWRARWYILTDRRIITRSGILDRMQSAILLERLQDVSLERPFPLSTLRGYGIVRIESAGKDSEERIPMEHADEFHRALTQALTPGR
jgi:membrane protein YdbS with pleckstrin-like domain